jgi:single-stranded-DNA-specific exonuclease
VGKAHLKLYLEQGDRMLEAIAFGKAAKSPQLRKRKTVRVAFTPQTEGTSIQLMVRDFKIIEESPIPLPGYNNPL